MSKILIIICIVNLFIALIFGSLYWGTKSMGLSVPSQYVPLDRLLNLPFEKGLACSDVHIQSLSKDLGGVSLEGAHEAKMLQCLKNNQPVLISAIYWKDTSRAKTFWKRYYKNICRNHIRKKAFRNNIWQPEFVTGRYGANAPFDITAWYKDNWFFFIGVSTKLEDFNKVKGRVRNFFMNHTKEKS